MSLARWLYFLTVCVLTGCAGPIDPAESVQIATRDRFELVSGVLEASCGSLDCHGQVGRNLRIYSQLGLRQDASKFPGLGAGVVSAREIESNYRAATSLEPELLSLVVRDQGKDPERLTLIRKARGAEEHKGGKAIVSGGAADRCLISWLASRVDESACADGAVIARPEVVPPG